MTADIIFSKGGYSEGIYCDNVNEEYSNKLIQINVPQTESNQENGKKDTKILDLLRITHQFVIKGYITNESGKTAKEIKTNLKTIANGAATAGGTITMTYEGYTYNGYIEKLTFVDKALDQINETSLEVSKYEVSVTFIVGVKI